MANLVVTDARCNLDKHATLPVPRHFQRAISRPRAALTEVASSAESPVLETRTRTGTGLCSSIPPGTALWSATGTYEISE
ncbi:hypothetical protein [Rhodococcus sp. NPDC058521]|uniref:hypothetical protein n=1 Tax=Rhodococcus sp. NPDC058521 TaxID=3346536 RepID=UPI00365ECFDF